jgi:hypothetical protein
MNLKSIQKFDTLIQKRPMEDCGGIYSYNEIVQAIENPTLQNQHHLGEDGENYYEGFVPSHFDKDEINHFWKTSKDEH